MSYSLKYVSLQLVAAALKLAGMANETTTLHAADGGQPSVPAYGCTMSEDWAVLGPFQIGTRGTAATEPGTNIEHDTKPE